MNFLELELLPSQVSSALVSSMPTSLIGIVLDYSRSPIAATGYRRDRLVFGGSAPDVRGTDRAFAVRMGDGSVTCWGDASFGGDSSLVQARLHNVKAICGARSAFAAIVGDDNTVICWGNNEEGGDCSTVAGQLTQVEGICAARIAFAALKRDGTVVTWGDKDFGGDSSSVQSRLKGVTAIYSTEHAFAAVLHDGTVETWGARDSGGWIPPAVAARLKQASVQCISGIQSTFAALLSDGSVVTWGAPSGDSSKLASELTQVKLICATDWAFAALKTDGTVVIWGEERCGGDSPEVRGELKDVVALCSASCLFTAVRNDGSVVTWGRYGGEVSNVRLADVVALCGAYRAFAAVRKDGTVTTWGDSHAGMLSGPLYPFDIAGVAVQSELKQVVSISAAGMAFAAVRSDGKVVTWGDRASDGFFRLPAGSPLAVGQISGESSSDDDEW